MVDRAGHLEDDPGVDVDLANGRVSVGDSKTEAGVTLRVYAHAMRRDEGNKDRLKAFVEGRDWAPLGTTGPDEGSRSPTDHQTENEETSASAEASDNGRGWFRTSDLSRVKRALSH
jgi:hypothetical protein